MGKPLIWGGFLLCSYCGPVSLLYDFELVMVRYMLQMHDVLLNDGFARVHSMRGFQSDSYVFLANNNSGVI